MKNRFINKRKKSFFKVYIFCFLIFIIFFIYLYLNINKFANLTTDLIQEYSNKYNYNLKKIEVIGLTNLNKDEILIFFNKFKNSSIFLVPVKEISNEIKKNKWIKEVNIRNDYKNTLKVNIKEETPIGIYENNNQKILFSKNLVILEILRKNHDYKNLISFYGENSIINSKHLISKIDQDIKQMIQSLIFVENRRWNIRLKNKITLKLPEKNLEEAIKNYKKIYSNLSNKDLKDIEIIDLRIPNQAIIKYRNTEND
ncbi:cell division protein FtsQ/DivIB [Alphaproteobacteria bacterium]|nr:cell division protein FtsQ/DivIB [Alphaproteobacteria bacterium]